MRALACVLALALLLGAAQSPAPGSLYPVYWNVNGAPTSACARCSCAYMFLHAMPSLTLPTDDMQAGRATSPRAPHSSPSVSRRSGSRHPIVRRQAVAARRPAAATATTRWIASRSRARRNTGGAAGRETCRRSTRTAR